MEKQLLQNFLVNIGNKQDWTSSSFVNETVEDLKKKIGKK